METSISLHYSNYSPTFRYKIFDLQHAIHSKSKVPVTIWTFNISNYLQSNQIYTADQVNNFINKFRISLYASQKINHPNILRIYEITDEDVDKNLLSFSSEQIKFCLNGLGTKAKENFKCNQDESLFISSELSNGLLYLQTELKVAHFAICPENIFITPQFEVKISNLVYFSKFFELSSIIEPNLYPSNTSFFDIDPRFLSPELREHRNITANVDIYMLGLTILYCYEGILFLDDMMKQISERKDQTKFILNYLDTCTNTPDDIKTLIKPFFNENPNERPSIKNISESDVLSTLIIKVLDFIDSVSEKPIENRKNFYRGLAGVIDQYSSRILIAKFIPVLVNDIVSNAMNTEFVEQVLQLLITSSAKLSIKKIDQYILSKIWTIDIVKNYLIDRSEQILDRIAQFICLFCTIVIYLHRNQNEKYKILLNSFLQKIQHLDKNNYQPIFKSNEFIDLIISELPNQNDLNAEFIQSFVQTLYQQENQLIKEKVPSLIPILLQSISQKDLATIENNLLPFYTNFSNDHQIQVKCILKILENFSINSFIEKLVQITVTNCSMNNEILSGLSTILPIYLSQTENIDTEIINTLMTNESDHKIILSHLDSIKNNDLKIDILRSALLKPNEDPKSFAMTFINVSTTENFYEKYKTLNLIKTDFITPLLSNQESAEIIVNNFQSFESNYQTTREIQRLIIEHILENESQCSEFVSKVPELIDIYKPDQDETLNLLKLNKYTHSLLTSIKGQIDRDHMSSFCIILNDLYERGNNEIVNDIIDILTELPPATEHSYLPVSLALKLVDDKSLEIKQIENLLSFVDITVNAIREYKGIKAPDILTNGSSGNPFSSKNVPPQENHFNINADNDSKKYDIFSPASGDVLFSTGALQSNDSGENTYSSVPQHAAVNPFQDDTVPTEDPFAIHNNSNDPALKEINQFSFDQIKQKPSDPISLPMHDDPFSSPPKAKDNTSQIPVEDPFNTPSKKQQNEEQQKEDVASEDADKKKKKHDKKRKSDKSDKKHKKEKKEKKDKKEKKSNSGQTENDNQSINKPKENSNPFQSSQSFNSPENDPFKKKTASDPFSLPLDTDPFSTASTNSQQPDPFHNSAITNQNDPFKNSAISSQKDPFKDSPFSNNPYQNSANDNQKDPFKDSQVKQEDPFKNSEVAQNADPFKDPPSQADPFTNSAIANQSDPFKNSTIANQPDPFKNSEVANQSDPFKNSTIANQPDPFKNPPSQSDPFKNSEVANQSDPFKNSTIANQPDPFNNSTIQDPFAQNSNFVDPFKTIEQQNSPFSTPTQPKSAFQGDPFAHSSTPRPFSPDLSPFKSQSKEEKSSDAMKPDDNPFSSSKNKDPYQSNDSNDKGNKKDEESSKHGKKHHHSKKKGHTDSGESGENDLKASKRKKSQKSSKNTQQAHQSAQPQSTTLPGERGHQKTKSFALFDNQGSSSSFLADPPSELHRTGSVKNATINFESDDLDFADD